MRTTTVLLTVLILCGVARAQEEEGPASTKKLVERPLSPRSKDADVHAALEKRLPELRFDNVGFADVIDFLRDVTGANIFVNWKQMEEGGVDKNAPVTARLRDVPMGKALTIILDSVGGQTKLAYKVDSGVLMISTAEAFGRNIVVKTYDVRSLEPWRKNAAPTTQPTDVKDPLIAMITGSIDPKSWAKGGAGKIEESGGQLLVTATEANQKLIANLIDNLKRMAK